MYYLSKIKWDGVTQMKGFGTRPPASIQEELLSLLI